MREIKNIVVHCTATAQNAKIQAILDYWKYQLNWKRPGYHCIIEANGNIVSLHPIELPSNGVAGFNANIVNVCYIGGVDAKNNPIDNRTPQQKQALINILKTLKSKFPNAIICGHRDFPNVAKACPCFDAKKEYSNL